MLNVNQKALQGVLAQFKCAKRYSILRRFAEQITYRYRYFNKNVYFAKHNNCKICYKNVLNLTLNLTALPVNINNVDYLIPVSYTHLTLPTKRIV